MNQRSKRFPLIELMIVIAIVALVSGIATARFAVSRARETARSGDQPQANVRRGQSLFRREGVVLDVRSRDGLLSRAP